MVDHFSPPPSYYEPPEPDFYCRLVVGSVVGYDLHGREHEADRPCGRFDEDGAEVDGEWRCSDHLCGGCRGEIDGEGNEALCGACYARWERHGEQGETGGN